MNKGELIAALAAKTEMTKKEDDGRGTVLEGLCLHPRAESLSGHPGNYGRAEKAGRKGVRGEPLLPGEYPTWADIPARNAGTSIRNGRRT